MLIFGEKERVGDWVGRHIGNAHPWHDYEAIGIERNGQLVGGFVIDNYIAGARCSVHCAGIGRHWLTREALYAVFDYVFRQLACQAIVNIVAGCNAESRRFTAHLGFAEVHRIKGGGRDGSDGIIFEMQKTDCKWLKKGQKNE